MNVQKYKSPENLGKADLNNDNICKSQTGWNLCPEEYQT